VSNTSLLTRAGNSFRGVNSNLPLTLAERLIAVGYTKDAIVQGLEAMVAEAQGVQGGRKSLVSFAVGGLAHSFNRDCSSGLSDLSAVVDSIVGKEKKGDAVPPAVDKALQILDAASKTADRIVHLKKMLGEEKVLAAKVESAADVPAAKKAFKEYQTFMQAYLIMIASVGSSASTLATYLKQLKQDADDAVATGAAPHGGRDGATLTPSGGRHGSSKAARLEALKTALLVGDVKYLAMLDMTDVKLSAADRMVAAQIAAQYRGASLDKFEAGIHSALGGRGLSALRVAGLL
jgi:hypothetical protein